MRVASLVLFIMLSTSGMAAQVPAKEVDTCSLLTNEEAASIVEGIGNGHLLRDHIQRRICIWEVLPPDGLKRPLWIQVRPRTIEEFNMIRASASSGHPLTKIEGVGDEAFDLLDNIGQYDLYVRKGTKAFSVIVGGSRKTILPILSSTAKAVGIRVAGRL